jgi:hypothetical protein
MQLRSDVPAVRRNPLARLPINAVWKLLNQSARDAMRRRGAKMVTGRREFLQMADLRGFLCRKAMVRAAFFLGDRYGAGLPPRSRPVGSEPWLVRPARRSHSGGRGGAPCPSKHLKSLCLTRAQLGLRITCSFVISSCHHCAQRCD